MVIAIRKEPNGSIYIDKNIRENIDYTEPPYNFTLIEIPDKYIDVESCDFNDDLILNIDKYTARKERELAERKKLYYEDAIVSKIREKYTVNEELAILRQRDSKPEEFAEYNDYVELCKIQVKESMEEIQI